MVRRGLVAVVIVLLALAVASVPLFILYDDEPLPKADAVVVLAGSENRLPVGRELVEAGVAPVLVISDGLDPRWTAANRLCRFEHELRVLCPRPEPYSTRGEARMVAALARDQGWDEVVVVSSRFHLLRVRLLFERCFDGELGTVAAPNPTWRLPLSIALEWLKLGNAAVARSC